MKSSNHILLPLTMLTCFTAMAQEKAAKVVIYKKQEVKTTIKTDTSTGLQVKYPNPFFTINEPLYILDGIAINTKQFSKINPNEIEDISILKNEPANSSSGNNKTVVIRTKKGVYKKLPNEE